MSRRTRLVEGEGGEGIGGGGEGDGNGQPLTYTAN
jgi:hypothetical protein